MAKIMNVSMKRGLNTPFELQGFSIDVTSIKTSKKDKRTYGRLVLAVDGQQQTDLSGFCYALCTNAKNTKIAVSKDDPTIILNTPELFNAHDIAIVDGAQCSYDGETFSFE